ncbi:head-tail connector protein [Candidatus Darwinibacter acetoxidans]
MLQAVKTYLKITWDDEDALLQAIIERGKAYLNDLTGSELDFDTDGQPKSLLLDYCRYVHNNASEYFEENFAREIIRLQLQVAAEGMSADGRA